MMGACYIVGAVLVLVASPTSAAEKPIPLDIVVGWMLVLDGGTTDRAGPAIRRASVGPLDGQVHIATSSLSADLVDFERLAPVMSPILTLSRTRVGGMQGTPIAALGHALPPRETRSPVLALEPMSDPGRPPRPKASPFDVMVFLRVTGQDAFPKFGFRGGMAAIAWRAAMMGTGRMPLPTMASR